MIKVQIFLAQPSFSHRGSHFLQFQNCVNIMCGVGFKHTLTTATQYAVIGFYSDHTINRFGFNMSFTQFTGGKLI